MNKFANKFENNYTNIFVNCQFLMALPHAEYNIYKYSIWYVNKKTSKSEYKWWSTGENGNGKVLS